MFERFFAHLTQYTDSLFHATSMLLIGVLVSLGRDMQRVETVPVRGMVGRAITTAILALSAGSVLAVIPGMPWIGLIGLSAALASLGTDFLERAVLAWLKIKGMA